MSLQIFLYFAVSLLASIAGAICGIGGGVIIKPTLDFFGWDSVSAISFLSGCTVFSMTAYSVLRTFVRRDRSSGLNLSQSTPLAAGSVLGGIAGKELFSAIARRFANPDRVGAVQAICLFAVTAVVLVYTCNKHRVRTRHTSGVLRGMLVGAGLGLCSSFLGIGGGPINLMVLGYFYSMDTKTAASNSLYVILFSQAASIVTTLVTNTVPSFSWVVWVLMVAGGISGGVIGRRLSRRLENAQVDRLFTGMMILIMLICVYNAWRFTCA